VRQRPPLADLPPALAPGGFDVLLAALADSDPPVQRAVFAAVAEIAPDAVLFAGDAAYAGSSDRKRRAALRRWRSDWGALARRVYAVPGNHDFDSPNALACWREEMAPGPGAPEGHEGLTFALEAGPVLAVGMTAARGLVPPAQRAWAAETLARSAAPHRIAVFHEPAFPNGPRVGESLDARPAERDELWHVLEDGGVALVVNGHEHGYSRRIVRGRRPIVQVVAAGAGGTLHGDRLEGVERHVPAFHFLEIAADSRRLRCRALALDGRVLDAFELAAGGSSLPAGGERGRRAPVT
jgi:3',5'-cyclic AMP phosphodiesterase CpdA